MLWLSDWKTNNVQDYFSFLTAVNNPSWQPKQIFLALPYVYIEGEFIENMEWVE